MESFPLTYGKSYFWDAEFLHGILLAAHAGRLSFEFVEEKKSLKPIEYKNELILNFDLTLIKDQNIIILAVGLSNGKVELFYNNLVIFFIV